MTKTIVSQRTCMIWYYRQSIYVKMSRIWQKIWDQEKLTPTTWYNRHWNKEYRWLIIWLENKINQYKIPLKNDENKYMKKMKKYMEIPNLF